MASILSFLNQAVDSLISSGSGLNTGCKLVLSCAGESVTFPVSPPSFEISNAYNNSTINVNSLGDINMLGKRGLTTIKFSSFFPAQAYDDIVNTTPDSPYSYVEKINSFAQKGQPCKDGTIEIGRPHWTIGAHTYGENSHTIGIHVCGNFEIGEPTSKQIESLAMLLANICTDYGLPIDTTHVVGHRDLMATACPGYNLYKILQTIRGKAVFYQQQ